MPKEQDKLKMDGGKTGYHKLAHEQAVHSPSAPSQALEHACLTIAVDGRDRGRVDGGGCRVVT